eukprot:CAMPEP_0198225942 /NCGR_PEP_ID=MMETSP1445-20131203/103197_1 /TAXON_ID=36898 /ORGANISM="Pyramimonas sp., Strain CCMP2087" /LENGTH=83 /DNA_ID=CAMNT_0043905625 /DNA_START=10 /DNA_END=261 /DNA_ORIENTATION=-
MSKEKAANLVNNMNPKQAGNVIAVMDNNHREALLAYIGPDAAARFTRASKGTPATALKKGQSAIPARVSVPQTPAPDTPAGRH